MSAAQAAHVGPRGVGQLSPGALSTGAFPPGCLQPVLQENSLVGMDPSAVTEVYQTRCYWLVLLWFKFLFCRKIHLSCHLLSVALKEMICVD